MEEISHAGLHQYRIVKGSTPEELQRKKQAILAKWDEQWEKKCSREAKIKSEEDSLKYAKELTEQAEAVQEAMDTILLDNMKPFSVEDLMDHSSFDMPCPPSPCFLRMPSEPSRSNPKYNTTLSGLAKLSKKKVEENDRLNQKRYDHDIKEWKKECDNVKRLNDVTKQRYDESMKSWNDKKKEFEDNINASNDELKRRYDKFTKGDIDSVEWFVGEAIDHISLPFEYRRFSDLEFVKDTKSLIIDFMLPNLEDIPSLKSVTYIKTRGEMKESYESESYLKKKYESVIYQIVLATLAQSFGVSKGMDLIENISLNGLVHTVDKSTGQEIEPYILSLNTSRTDFETVNLASVGPKEWFKSSKGVSAASLAKVTPVAPIIKMSKTDRRFIEGHDVADTLDESVNLAAIDWQEFEHLIREIFEKEFKSNGGEVKITQASRDGGVDAVAFDPDPIRGGKIVIQAKRYTNVVGVSAVRDLYGTVMNEGAIKGILVTTSNYGNDAYEFANGKPLTLMNGANLLYLMEKHGYKARIDLKEAKEMMKE